MEFYDFTCSSMQRIHKAKLLKSIRLYSSDWIVAQVQALRHWGIGRVGVAVWGWDLEEGAGERKGERGGR